MPFFTLFEFLHYKQSVESWISLHWHWGISLTSRTQEFVLAFLCPLSCPLFILLFYIISFILLLPATLH